jgi:hypothetical protein
LIYKARWQSGHAAACKAVYAGSIPTLASIQPVRVMVARALKMFGIVWLIARLLTSALDTKGESEHRADYSATLPTGKIRFNARQFAGRMIADGAVLLVVWPGAVGCGWFTDGPDLIVFVRDHRLPRSSPSRLHRDRNAGIMHA